MILKKAVEFDQQKEIIKKITEEVWLAWKQKKGAAFIIKIKNGVVLIDSSGDPYAKTIIEALRQLDLHPKDVKLIFNTHYHFEQIAGNQAFADARIYAHQDEVPFINGEKKGNQKMNLSNFFKSPYTKKLINDLLDNTKLTYEDFCLYVFHTPGHTEGGASYLYNKMLFVGDLIINKEGYIFLSPSHNTNFLHNSIKRLKLLNFDFLCLGDGHIYHDGKSIVDYFASNFNGKLKG